MATRDTGQPAGKGITRRGFLQATAATAVAGCGLGFAFDAEKAAAYEGQPGYTVKPSTCPYCSACCGQRVVVENATGKVVDIYGDFESPFNTGGLCAKGAGSLQLVNNPRRIGAWTAADLTAMNQAGGVHPVNPVFAADGTTNGVAYKRIGNGDWSAMDLQTALGEIVSGDGVNHTGLLSYRGNVDNGANSKGVAFFGSSHMNNEQNYLYRKLIAAFGSSNVEHQARI